jgi:hypothetical protein
VTQHQRVALSISIASGLVIAVATLTPSASTSGPQQFDWCFGCGDDALADVIANVILFIPFGFGLRWLGVRRIWVAAIALGLTTCVECLQISVVTGRDPSARDIATNFVGALIGIALADTARSWALPAHRQARVLLRGGIAVWAVLLVSSALFLGADMEPGGCFVDWAPTGGEGDWFHGSLVRAAVNGMILPEHADSVPNCARLARGQQDRHLELVAEIIPGQPTFEGSTILSLGDSRGDYFAVNQTGKAVTVHLRTRAEHWRLRTPELLLRDGATENNALGAPSPLLLSGSLNGTELRATSSHAGSAASSTLTLTPFLLWTLLLPFNLANSSIASAVTVLVLASLLFPIGYWFACSAVVRERGWPRSIRGLPWEPLLVPVVLATLPIAFGYPPASVAVWLGSVVGLAAGALSAGVRRRGA